jgi:hypothetical protein
MPMGKRTFLLNMLSPTFMFYNINGPMRQLNWIAQFLRDHSTENYLPRETDLDVIEVILCTTTQDLQR